MAAIRELSRAGGIPSRRTRIAATAAALTSSTVKPPLVQRSVLSKQLDGLEGHKSFGRGEIGGRDRKAGNPEDVLTQPVVVMMDFRLTCHADLLAIFQDPADFERFAGKLARVTTSEPIGEQSFFEGRLSGITGGKVRLELEGKNARIVEVPLEAIRKANLVVEW